MTTRHPEEFDRTGKKEIRIPLIYRDADNYVEPYEMFAINMLSGLNGKVTFKKIVLAVLGVSAAFALGRALGLVIIPGIIDAVRSMASAVFPA